MGRGTTRSVGFGGSKPPTACRRRLTMHPPAQGACNRRSSMSNSRFSGAHGRGLVGEWPGRRVAGVSEEQPAKGKLRVERWAAECSMGRSSGGTVQERGVRWRGRGRSCGEEGGDTGPWFVQGVGKRQALEWTRPVEGGQRECALHRQQKPMAELFLRTLRKGRRADRGWEQGQDPEGPRTRTRRGHVSSSGVCLSQTVKLLLRSPGSTAGASTFELPMGQQRRSPAYLPKRGAGCHG